MPKRTNGRTNFPVGLRTAFRAADAVSPRLAARLAAPLFLATRRHPVPDRERTVLRGAQRQSLETPRGRAVAWVWSEPTPAPGPAPTVFLVHGWEGRGSQLGAFVEPLRRAGLRVVAVDAPGHGEAPGRSSSLPAIAAALETAAERWRPGVGVVAHSAGAISATWAFARGLEPERAVFVAPGSDLRSYTDGFAGLLGMGEEARSHLARRIERRIGVTYRELEPLERAPDLGPPLLAFTDRDDTETRLEAVERLVGLWPGAELRVTEGLGHRRILRDSGVVEAAVRFLAGAEVAQTDPAAQMDPAAQINAVAQTDATAPAELAEPSERSAPATAGQPRHSAGGVS